MRKALVGLVLIGVVASGCSNTEVHQRCQEDELWQGFYNKTIAIEDGMCIHWEVIGKDYIQHLTENDLGYWVNTQYDK